MPLKGTVVYELGLSAGGGEVIASNHLRFQVDFDAVPGDELRTTDITVGGTLIHSLRIKKGDTGKEYFVPYGPAASD